MPDPFESARRKIARAKDHIADLERKMGRFLKKPPYEAFTEPHPNKPDHIVHKIRLTRRSLPVKLPEIAADALANLRDALDQALYAVALSRFPDPKYASFPFSGTAARFEAALQGNCKHVPKEIYPLLRRFQPYRGGNEFLFALKEARNRGTHAVLVPVVAASISLGVNLCGTGYFSIPEPLVWDRSKNEMELHTLGPGAKFKGQFDFRFFVAFGEIEGLNGEHAIETLYKLVGVVEGIVAAIEAESRRLGFIK